jgi:hypothetical protein
MKPPFGLYACGVYAIEAIVYAVGHRSVSRESLLHLAAESEFVDGTAAAVRTRDQERHLPAKHLSRAGQRKVANGRRFQRQRGHVLRFEMMHIGLSTRTRKHLDLQRHRMQEITHTLGAFFDIETLHQFWILGSDSDRATPGVTMMASVWRGTERLIIRNVDWLIAIKGDE